MKPRITKPKAEARYEKSKSGEAYILQNAIPVTVFLYTYHEGRLSRGVSGMNTRQQYFQQRLQATLSHAIRANTRFVNLTEASAYDFDGLHIGVGACPYYIEELRIMKQQ